MPSVVSIGTALPKYTYTLNQIKEVCSHWLKSDKKKFDLFERFLSSSKTNKRHFAIPASQVLELEGLQARAELFEILGTELGVQSFHAVLNESNIDPKAVTASVFTSCSCPSIPSIDALILEKVGLPRTNVRIPIFQHGCAGGVVGLKLCSELSKSHPLVSLTSVELCSLVFQSGDTAAAQLVGAAIFADGAASVLVSHEDRGLVIKDTQSYIVPNSRHLMGYDLLDDGLHLRLDKDLPRALIEVAPARIQQFLAMHQLTTKDIGYWLFHPGGTKILDFFEETFQLTASQAPWSREVLSTVGNLSSATVLFVLDAFLKSKVIRAGERALMVGVGPGLTLELILFEWVA